MTNTKELLEVIGNSGYKKKYLAESLDLSPYGFMKKVNGINDFTVPEMDKLCGILSIKGAQKHRIFFTM